jgi:hypothetical protein
MNEVHNFDLQCDWEWRIWWKDIKNKFKAQLIQDMLFQWMLPLVLNQDSSCRPSSFSNKEEYMIDTSHIPLAY